MTKQEEIRQYLAQVFYFSLGDKPRCSTIQSLQVADGIMNYLHSQGVVIKVEGELPKFNNRGLSNEQAEYEGDIWITAIEHMILSGYEAVEPLIET